MTGEPQLSPRNRYFGRVILVFAGACMLRLADGRRASVSAKELAAADIELKPSDRIECSIYTSGEGALSAFDLTLV
jgi:hypothetical protein